MDCAGEPPFFRGRGLTVPLSGRSRITLEGELRNVGKNVEPGEDLASGPSSAFG